MNHSPGDTLRFAQPIVIYLNAVKGIPEESTLLLEFEGQGTFSYKVKNYVYLNHDITDLNRNKMVLLIPFQLLRLRDAHSFTPTKENLAALKRLVENDIIESIEANVKVGNALPEDASELLELTGQLYTQLYPEVESEGGTDMKRRLEGAWELPNDKYRDRICDLEEQIEQMKTEHQKEAQTYQQEKQEMQKQIEALTARLRELEN